MGMTMTQQILAAHAGLESVKAGQLIEANLSDSISYDAQINTDEDNSFLDLSFNKDLGTLNVTRFNQELKKSNLTTTQIKADLAGAGATGAMAFNNLGSSILKTNIQLKQTSQLLDSLATSMANTIR